MIHFNAFTGSKLHAFEQAYTRCRNASVVVPGDWIMNMSIQYWQKPWGLDPARDWPPPIARIERDVRSAHSCMRALIGRYWKWPYWPSVWNSGGEPDWFNYGKTEIVLDRTFGFATAEEPWYGEILNAQFDPPFSVDDRSRFGQDGIATQSVPLGAHTFIKPTTPIASGWSIRCARWFPPGGPLVEGQQRIIIGLRYHGKVFAGNQEVHISTKDGSGSILDDFPETRGEGDPDVPEAYWEGTDLIYEGDLFTESDSYDVTTPASEHLVPMPAFEVLDETMLDADTYGDTTIQGRTNVATFTPV
jgi:hypothetical protein